MASADYVFIQGNRKPTFAVQLLGALDDLPISLSGSTVGFYFREQGALDAKVSGVSASVTSATDGEVEYAWAAGDLDVPGLYDAEFRITFGDGRIQSVLITDVVVKEKLA